MFVGLCAGPHRLIGLPSHLQIRFMKGFSDLGQTAAVRPGTGERTCQTNSKKPFGRHMNEPE